MPFALHHPSNMTFHTNQLLHLFYTLCRLGEAAGSCDGKQMGKMHSENHCTAQTSSLWEVALRPWCGHCPVHSHLGRDQCYVSHAVSVFRMSDTKQQSTTGRENVAIHCFRGGRPRRGNRWTMHIFLKAIPTTSAPSHIRYTLSREAETCLFIKEMGPLGFSVDSIDPILVFNGHDGILEVRINSEAQKWGGRWTCPIREAKWGWFGAGPNVFCVLIGIVKLNVYRHISV